MAKRVDSPRLQGLALETVEWFPTEPIFWLNLAEILQGGYRELVAKRLALQRAVQLLPLDARIREEAWEVGRALGRIDRPAPLERPPLLGKPEEVCVQSYHLRLQRNMRLSEVIGLACDLAENALEMMNASKRTKTAAHNPHVHKAGLASPIDITYQEPEPREEKPAVEPVEEEPSLLLSQAGSIKNFHDYSQVSTRSQSRRLREKDSDQHHQLSEPRLSAELLGRRLMDVFGPVSADEDELASLSHLLHLHDERQRSAANSFTSSDIFIDPSVPELPSEALLIGLLGTLSDYLVYECQDAKWSVPLITAASRLAVINISQIETVVEYYPVEVLVWLAEFAVFQDTVERTVADYLLPRLERKLLRSNASRRLFFRFLWAKLHHTGSEADFGVLERAFCALKDPQEEILVLGGIGETVYPVLSGDAIRLLRERRHQSHALERAREYLQGPRAMDWIAENASDPMAWLGRIQCDRDLCEIALLLHRAHHDRRVKQDILILTLVHVLYCDKQHIPLVLATMAESPRTLLLLCKQPAIVSDLLQHSFETAELFTCIFECLRTLHLLGDHCDLVLSMWRDMLMPRRLHLADAEVLIRMKRGLFALDNQNQALMILKYCVYKCIAGTPAISLPDDASGLVDLLGDDKLEGGEGLDASEAIDFFRITSQLADLEMVEANKLVVFLDRVIEVLDGALATDRTMRAALRGLERVVYGSVTRDPDIGSVKILPETDLTSTLRAALSLRFAESRKLPHHRKKTLESIRTQQSDLWKRIVLEPSAEMRAELVWLLGASFDAELHLWLARDAASLLRDSQGIARSLTGAFNCWTLALKDPHLASLDNVKLGKFLTFVASMEEGILSMFIEDYGPVVKRAIGARLKAVLKAVEAKDSLDRWRIAKLKALTYDLVGQHVLGVAALYATSLRRFLESNPSGNPEIVYRLCTKILGRLVIPKEGVESLRHQILEAMLGDLRTTGFLDILPPAAEGPEPRIALMAQQLGRLDKKRTNHRHHYILAIGHTTRPRGDEEEIDMAIIRKHWSKLVPLLAKGKSNQLVNVWQSDVDYPGDYLYFIEKYLRELGKRLECCSHESLAEAAEVLATIIGRVAVSPNIIVRRRLLLRQLMLSLHTIRNRADSGRSRLGGGSERAPMREIHEDALTPVGEVHDDARMPGREIHEDALTPVREIYEDALELVRSHGVDLPLKRPSPGPLEPRDVI